MISTFKHMQAIESDITIKYCLNTHIDYYDYFIYLHKVFKTHRSICFPFHVQYFWTPDLLSI